MKTIEDWFPEDVRNKYQFLNYNHAAEILTQSFPDEYEDLLKALRNFSIKVSEIETPGGNESPIPPKFNKILDPLGWKEIRITGDLVIRFYPRKGEKKGIFSNKSNEEKILHNYIDGHNIDFVKNRVAIDVEWNSKDQTFDRDLFAMRTYYECNVISIGIIITRSEEINNTFSKLGPSVKQKYGASTTWMGKLEPRLESRRHGGCPILAIGITSNCVEWDGMYEYGEQSFDN